MDVVELMGMRPGFFEVGDTEVAILRNTFAVRSRCCGMDMGVAYDDGHIGLISVPWTPTDG